MVAYSLSHLTQPDDQRVHGPIQDDEALFLFALIRVTRLKRIVEIGAAEGYSATNFCAAVGPDGVVYSVDQLPCPKVAANHVVIHKDIVGLTAADLGGASVGLIFFDCHAYEAQLSLFQRLRRDGIIVDHSILALHDTNLWPSQITPSSYEIADGWVHTPPERQMANDFKAMGYDVFSLGTERDSHGPHLPFRCGLTIATKFKMFELKDGPRAPWMVNEAAVSRRYRKVGEFDYEYEGT